MANAREIRTRIQSVSNTMKITRTMEMVATVKSKQAQDRLKGAMPYNSGIDGIVRRLVAELGEEDHPLFRTTEKPKKVVLLTISSSRGFCGGYNTNIINLARQELEELDKAGVPCEFHVSGKKALSYFRIQKTPVDREFAEFDDKVTYKDLDSLASEYIRRFQDGDIDEVRVVSYRFQSSSRQAVEVSRLLPMEPVRADDGGEDGPGRAEFFLFDPPPETLLREIVPFAVKTALFTLFLEAGTSEQIARRMAMKLATDNATEMIRELRSIYNRARQDQITMELLDIMGGTTAMEG